MKNQESQGNSTQTHTEIMHAREHEYTQETKQVWTDWRSSVQTQKHKLERH